MAAVTLPKSEELPFDGASGSGGPIVDEPGGMLEQLCTAWFLGSRGGLLVG